METTPDRNGHFGIFGGRYIPETLITAHEELANLYASVKDDDDFRKEYYDLLKNYCGRPTPLYHAKKFSERVGTKVYLKREDLNHTGAHKVNNTIGQGLLAKRLGKKKLIAETGAGMHGVATATAAALLGMECEIFMGEIDIARQSQNVARMRMLGAKVNSVTSGSRTLKDAINEGLRAWISEVATTHYLMGTVAGSHPFPVIVRDFQSIIGVEARGQILEAEGRLPDTLVACVGGGSNAMGLFYPFVNDKEVEFVGVEAAGEGLDTGLHAASINKGSIGVIHGSMTYMLQDEDGQILETHSVSAGLDYPGVGPEHSHFNDTGRAKYGWVTDEQAIEAFFALTRDEGIIPALESSHALAWLMFNNDCSDKDNCKSNFKDNSKNKCNEKEKDKAKDKIVIVNLSGRGDKDMQIVDDYMKSRGK